MTFLKSYKRDKQGNMSILFAGGAGLILLVSGFAVDNFAATSKKLTAQDLLDNATLAYALSVQGNDGDDDSYQQTAEDMFNFDGRFTQTDVQSLAFTVSPDGTQAIGTAEILHKNPFGGITSDATRTLQVRATIGLGAADVSPSCIIALDVNATPGLLLNSGAEIIAEECEVHVHSTQHAALTVNHGTILEASKICVASNSVNTQGQVIDNLETSCDVAPDPFVGRFPVPDLSCDFSNGNYNDPQVTLQPGVYCGWHNFNYANADITLEPGTYVVRNGGWNVSGGNIDADGVTFYFADTSKIQFNNGVQASIIAPSAGDYAGVAFVESAGLSKTDMAFNGSNGFDVTGMVYLPSRNVIWNASSQIDGVEMNFIVNTMIVNQAEIDIAASDLIKQASTGTGGGTSVPYISQ